MRAVVQRVHAANCCVDGQSVGQINRGLLLFLGIGEGDSSDDVKYLVDKIVGLRVFADSEGKMNHSLAEIDGGLLVIPQFTLYGDVSRGLRPSFDAAAPPDRARQLFQEFLEAAQEIHTPVEAGEFGAMMDIEAENDGPVTVLIDSDGKF